MLHWHPKVQALLPAVGHIEVNEDPVEAVIREVLEETGLSVEIITDQVEPLTVAYPKEIVAPVVIMVEDIDDQVDGFHQHIDMVYFCSVVGDIDSLKKGWYWVTHTELIEQTPIAIKGGLTVQPPADVRRLGIQAVLVSTTFL